MLKFEECERIISDFYKSNNKLKLGWRFLYCSKDNFSMNNGILLIGMNPGGNKFEIKPYTNKGNAYRVEKYLKNKNYSILQKRVIYFFKKLSEKERINYERLMDECLSSNFIPFRSPNFNLLPIKQDCINFGYDFWRKIFKNIRFKVIICIGNGSNSAYRFINDILKYNNEKYLPIYNGASIKFNYSDNKEELLLVGLPHLSRYNIFNEKYKNSVNKVIEQISLYL